MSFENWEQRSPEQVAKDLEKSAADREKAIKAKAEEFLRLQDTVKQAEQLLENTRAELAAFFPTTEGEHTWTDGDFAVTVSIKPNWRWDSDKLEAMFAGAALPEHIKRRLSVAKGDYDKLDPAEQSKIAAALSIEDGQPRIRVKKRNV